MHTAWLSVSRACNNACRFCAVAESLDRQPLDPRVLRAELDAALDAGARRVVFTGGEPTLSAQLLGALAYARGRGARTAIATNGRLLADPDKVRRLLAVGLDEVLLSLHGATAATHDHLVGARAFHEATLALRNLTGSVEITVRTVLTRSNAAEVPALVDLAAAHGTRFELRRLTVAGTARAHEAELSLPVAEATEVLAATLRHARSRGVVTLYTGFDGVGRSGEPAAAVDRAVDEVDLELFRAGIPTRTVLGGGRAPAAPLMAEACRERRLDEDSLRLLWASRRMRLVDAPPPPSRAARPAGPDITFHVLCDRPEDPLLNASSLPGLAHELATRGARVSLYSPYEAPFDPARLVPPRSILGGLGRMVRRSKKIADPFDPGPEAAQAADQEIDRLIAVTARPAVVVGSWRSYIRLQRRLTGDVRWVLLDEGVLDGATAPPGPADVVRTPHASATAAYLAAGVPPEALHWRPWPVHAPHLPAPHDPGASGGVVVLGSVDGLGLPGWSTAPSPGLRPLPEHPVDALAALASCRLVFLPRLGAHEPAPARWLSLALALGRPVLGPDVPALADHVRDGHEGRLFANPTPEHARQLHADLTQLTHLGRGAARRARWATTATWADELLRGAPADRLAPLTPGHGPWYPW